MNIEKDIERVTTSPDYKTWIEDNKHAYLCSMFCMQDQDMIEDNVWQVSFYNPKKDTITTFTLPIDKRKKAEIIQKDSKIFKQKGEIVEKLKRIKLI